MFKTTAIPQATVEKVVPRPDVGCELFMEELDRLASEGFEPIRAALMPLVERYEAWIKTQADVSDLNASSGSQPNSYFPMPKPRPSALPAASRLWLNPTSERPLRLPTERWRRQHGSASAS